MHMCNDVRIHMISFFGDTGDRNKMIGYEQASKNIFFLLSPKPHISHNTQHITTHNTHHNTQHNTI